MQLALILGQMLKLSLKCLNIKPNDEVITAANTFVATIGAITELGAKPVFVDCDDTFLRMLIN